jgi:hypothetical protein
MRKMTDMVFETLVFSPFKHLTRLTARQNFIILIHRESTRSYKWVRSLVGVSQRSRGSRRCISMIILKRILVNVWIEIIWLRIGCNGGSCEHSDGSSGCFKVRICWPAEGVSFFQGRPWTNVLMVRISNYIKRHKVQCLCCGHVTVGLATMCYLCHWPMVWPNSRFVSDKNSEPVGRQHNWTSALCCSDGHRTNYRYQSVQRWATGWTIGVLGFDSRRGLGIFLFTTASRTALGPTQPPIQWEPGALSLGVKRPGREADHSPTSSAEVKELVELYLHSPITPSWRGAQLKHRDNFTFTFTFTGVVTKNFTCQLRIGRCVLPH